MPKVGLQRYRGARGTIRPLFVLLQELPKIA